MTIEELQEARRRLGEDQLQGRREECLERPVGHELVPIEASAQLYCADCLHMPEFDC